MSDKKLLTGLGVALVAFLFLFVVVPFVCTSSTTKIIAPPDTVEYRVSGTSGHYNITYANNDGNTAMYAGAGNDWYYKFFPPRGQLLYVSAQNQKSHGTVVVSILIGGRVWKSTESSGGYVIATASGLRP